MTITPQTANVDVGPFFPNGILYMPVPGPNSGQFLGLVSPAAWRIMQIALEGGTMTGKDCDAVAQAADEGAFTQTPLKSDPAGKERMRRSLSATIALPSRSHDARVHLTEQRGGDQP